MKRPIIVLIHFFKTWFIIIHNSCIPGFKMCKIRENVLASSMLIAQKKKKKKKNIQASNNDCVRSCHDKFSTKLMENTATIRHEFIS